MAASLVVVSGLISVAMQLGLHRRLALASVRCVVQLFLIGLVLRWIFAAGTPWYVVVGLGTIMTMIAGVVAVDRSERRYAGIVLDSVISMWACAWLVTGVALLAVVRPEPWYRPQYAIPLLGMILANTLNGISLGLNRFTREMTDRRAEIDTLLALGATRWEAARAAVQESIRTGMIPTINAMMIMGIVSLPGMMTGQLWRASSRCRPSRTRSSSCSSWPPPRRWARPASFCWATGGCSPPSTSFCREDSWESRKPKAESGVLLGGFGVDRLAVTHSCGPRLFAPHKEPRRETLSDARVRLLVRSFPWPLPTTGRCWPGTASRTT